MIRLLAQLLLLAIAAGGGALAALSLAEPPQRLPLVARATVGEDGRAPLARTDFPVCVHVNPNGDLAKPRGRPVNGRAIRSEIS